MKYNCCEKYLPIFSSHRCTALYIWYNFEFISVLNKQKCYYLSEASEIAHLESYEKCRLRNDNVWRGGRQLFNWILTPQQQHLQKGYYSLGEDFQKEKLEKFPLMTPPHTPSLPTISKKLPFIYLLLLDTSGAFLQFMTISYVGRNIRDSARP